MAVNLATLRDRLTYRNTATPALVRKDMGQLSQIDKQAEVETAKFRKRRNLAATIGTIFGFLAFVTFGLTLLIAVPAIVFAIQTQEKVKYHRRLDLPNYRYQLLNRLLPILERDMRPSGRVAAILQFDPPDNKTKVVRKIPHPRRPGWQIELFEDPWLTLRGRLIDGTRFALTLTQHHQERSGKNVNNKLRIRPRYKGIDLRLELKCLPQRYPNLATIKNPEQAVQLPKGVLLKEIRVDSRTLVLKAKLSEQAHLNFMPALGNFQATPSAVVSPQLQAEAEKNLEDDLHRTIVLMFMSAYQILNLTRMAEQKRA
jgi:hypothetical protein